MTIDINHDGKIDIAVGRNRKETHWKNKELKWSELVKKLSETHRTAETVKEYMASKKPRQDEIKDIGGFVGGYLSSGRRKPENVVHRQLITLDLDSAQADMWFNFTLQYGCAACIYSTHKHTAAAPRIRLVIPLDRPVFSDEYVAIGRRIAGDIGIEDFDHTGFQPSRLMYWPSTSKDGEFLFECQDGPWLSADEILSRYRNWRDSSEWPVSQRNDNVIQTAIKKQGDPLEKPGVVGAFCRTYDIHQAIDTFLPDAYDACDVENRYTYKEGSTWAGLIVYDGKFSYSHHGTDPTSGKLCNAFDLVRLHKYGLLDEEAREGTPGNKLPSYTAMIDFVTKDPEVRKMIVRERLQEAEDVFGTEDEDASEEPENDDWKEQLDMDKKGNLHSTINNVVLIMENDPKLKGRIAYDEFEQRLIATRNLPWRKINHQNRYWSDKDDANISLYLEKLYGMPAAKLDTAIGVISEKTRFHPVRDYLNTLQWDGEPRVETLFVEYMGAEDTPYVRAVTRKTITAAVARVMQPGVKFDYVLTIVGKQGLGKSSLIGKLGRQWFSDSFTTIQGKEAFEQIQGVWIVEIAELAGLRKAEVEAIKHYISKREDRYRVAYGKRVENFPRQCIFFASVNKKDFLKDSSGNRRWWPLDVFNGKPEKNVFVDLTDTEINQVWAEAVTLYKAGEPLYLDRELEQEAQQIQSRHSEQDDRTGIILRYLETLLPEDWEKKDTYERRAWLNGDKELQEEGTVQRQRVCAAEIWCEALGGFQKEMNSQNTRFIHDVMHQLDNWVETKNKSRFGIYGVMKGYELNVAAVAHKSKYGNNKGNILKTES